MNHDLHNLLAGAGLEHILMPRGQFIKEHQHLIKLLRTSKAPAMLREAADQEAELKRMTGGKMSKQSGFVRRMMAENYIKNKGEYGNPTAPLHPDSYMMTPVPFKYKKLATPAQNGNNETGNPIGASPFIQRHFGTLQKVPFVRKRGKAPPLEPFYKPRKPRPVAAPAAQPEFAVAPPQLVIEELPPAAPEKKKKKAKKAEEAPQPAAPPEPEMTAYQRNQAAERQKWERIRQIVRQAKAAMPDASFDDLGRALVVDGEQVETAKMLHPHLPPSGEDELLFGIEAAMERGRQRGNPQSVRINAPRAPPPKAAAPPPPAEPPKDAAQIRYEHAFDYFKFHTKVNPDKRERALMRIYTKTVPPPSQRDMMRQLEAKGFPVSQPTIHRIVKRTGVEFAEKWAAERDAKAAPPPPPPPSRMPAAVEALRRVEAETAARNQARKDAIRGTIAEDGRPKPPETKPAGKVAKMLSKMEMKELARKQKEAEAKEFRLSMRPKLSKELTDRITAFAQRPENHGLTYLQLGEKFSRENMDEAMIRAEGYEPGEKKGANYAKSGWYKLGQAINRWIDITHKEDKDFIPDVPLGAIPKVREGGYDFTKKQLEDMDYQAQYYVPSRNRTIQALSHYRSGVSNIPAALESIRWVLNVVENGRVPDKAIIHYLQTKWGME